MRGKGDREKQKTGKHGRKMRRRKARDTVEEQKW